MKQNKDIQKMIDEFKEEFDIACCHLSASALEGDAYEIIRELEKQNKALYENCQSQKQTADALQSHLAKQQKVIKVKNKGLEDAVSDAWLAPVTIYDDHFKGMLNYHNAQKGRLLRLLAINIDNVGDR